MNLLQKLKFDKLIYNRLIGFLNTVTDDDVQELDSLTAISVDIPQEGNENMREPQGWGTDARVSLSGGFDGDICILVYKKLYKSIELKPNYALSFPYNYLLKFRSKRIIKDVLKRKRQRRGNDLLNKVENYVERV